MRELRLMDKKRLAKIIVPACILLVVAGIWVFKNMDNGSANLVTPENEDDFSLEATAIDLEALMSYGLPIIIDFGSDSCIPCQEMAPVLEAMNTEMQGKAIIKFVDVWKNAGAADGFPVQVIPTQVFFNSDGSPYVPSDDVDIEFTMFSFKESGEHAFTVHQGGLTEDEMRQILLDMGVTE